MAWLIAGLGNPGERYAQTRHNVGRMVVLELAHRGGGARLRKVRFLPAEAAEVRIGEHTVWLGASTLYMNESGTSYAGLARKHRIEPGHVVAVHDEIEDPAGGAAAQARRWLGGAQRACVRSPRRSRPPTTSACG